MCVCSQKSIEGSHGLYFHIDIDVEFMLSTGLKADFNSTKQQECNLKQKLPLQKIYSSS